MPTEFTCFPQLPTELRILIWEFCIPRRVVEIRTPRDQVSMPTECSGLAWTSEQSCRPPVITRVCRESREVASKTGVLMRFDERYVWLDPRHDLLAQFDTYIKPDDEIFSVPPFNNWPLLHQHFARGQQAVISAQTVYGFPYFDGTSEPIPYDNLSNPLDFAEIASWKDYLVCLTIVPLHMTAAQVFESELFGATCEELVKLVDPMDTTLIQRLSHVYDPDDKGVKGFF